jgi:hypothetical protein
MIFKNNKYGITSINFKECLDTMTKEQKEGLRRLVEGLLREEKEYEEKERQLGQENASVSEDSE